MIGVANLYQEVFYESLPMDLNVDASACKGMVMRSGRGRVKHLSMKQLWIQGAVESWNIRVNKIPRSANCADCLTHISSHNDAKDQLTRMGYHR